MAKGRISEVRGREKEFLESPEIQKKKVVFDLAKEFSSSNARGRREFFIEILFDKKRPQYFESKEFYEKYKHSLCPENLHKYKCKINKLFGREVVQKEATSHKTVYWKIDLFELLKFFQGESINWKLVEAMEKELGLTTQKEYRVTLFDYLVLKTSKKLIYGAGHGFSPGAQNKADKIVAAGKQKNKTQEYELTIELEQVLKDYESAYAFFSEMQQAPFVPNMGFFNKEVIGKLEEKATALAKYQFLRDRNPKKYSKTVVRKQQEEYNNALLGASKTFEAYRKLVERGVAVDFKDWFS